MGVWKRRLLGTCAALTCGLFALDLVAQFTDTRTVSLRNIHTDDVVTVEFKRNGRYIPEALERINWVMRDWRRNEQTRMDPALIDLLWEVHRELGSQQPINLISAYRSRTTNNMLRNTVGGQASESRHILGKAADVQFPDVSVKQIRYAAMIRERGGVGYYPTSATPFVHIDTDRVRAWPRMPRFELALLFPNGRTLHKPADGGDITVDDARSARARQPEVAMQLAAFHDLRRKGREQPNLMTAFAPGNETIVFTPAPKPAVAAEQRHPQLAAEQRHPQLAAEQRPPQLVAEPRVAERPVRLSPRPTEDDRRKLTQLVTLVGMPQLVTEPTLAARPQAAKHKTHEPAGLAPSAPDSPFPRLTFLTAEGAEVLKGWSTGFVQSPAWDEDHPEEAAYRPFPLAPFLTTTASVDDPALTKLLHPDLSRTGELFENPGTIAPLKLRPGPEAAQLMWAQEQGGGSVDFDRLGKSDRTALVAARRVNTETAH